VKRLIMVLGMHRSGTSCLTGLLGESGVWLGPVEMGSPHNQKGNNENRRVMNTNKAVLAANDSSWRNPPEADAEWPAAQTEAADEILRDVLDEGRITAMKDPRSLFTGEMWRQRAELLGARVELVGTFRRPRPVAESLFARDPLMSIADGEELWERYNRRLLDLHDSRPFPLIDFDLGPDPYLAAVRAAFDELGLDVPPAFEFFERDLRHQEPRPVSGSHAATYAELQRRSVS
jgi:hypothetical protein